MEFGWITGGGVIVAMDGKSPEEEIDRKEKIHCEKSQWMFCWKINFNVFLDNYTTESLLKEALVSKSLIYKWVR